MPRLSDAVLDQITERHRAVTLGLYHHASEPGRLRRISDSLDDIPALVAALREAVAALEEARRWFDHGQAPGLTYEDAANAVRAALGLESHREAMVTRARAALRDGGAAGREA